MEILLVEDDPTIAAALAQSLEEEGHTVVTAVDGGDGLALALDHEFDAMILDVMLPGLDGLTVARRLRDRHNPTPILMLTARDLTRDVVDGLDAGADDYLVKPFAIDELLARLRAIGRRPPAGGAPTLAAADLLLDPASHTVTRGMRPLELTRAEFKLLEVLLRRKGRVVVRSAIIDAVWGYASEVEDNTLDVLVSQLRRKVDGPGDLRLLHTVRGLGYCLREP